MAIPNTPLPPAYSAPEKSQLAIIYTDNNVSDALNINGP